MSYRDFCHSLEIFETVALKISAMKNQKKNQCCLAKTRRYETWQHRPRPDVVISVSSLLKGQADESF